ncbi:hypothetical protein [Streptomyces sp. RerS4]|uniref:hypothetical protein n=1 Tax=Streptomyces sp. RerS4 TaxID=2942449 RepID=UPI00201BFEC6|nr:hypothetical protein [Streptomyces sp. RerS4]UQW99248.1 hypothetical protein M4D82_00855 [Streptomyces sp. RerS4]
MEVDVEAAHGQQDRLEVLADLGLVFLRVIEVRPPLLVDLWAEDEVLLTGIDLLDAHPEEADQVPGKGSQGDVVGVRPAPSEVVDQQLADVRVLDRIAVDELLMGIFGFPHLSLWGGANLLS